MPFVRLSPLWSSFFAVFATVIIGVVFSAITGEISIEKEKPKLSSYALVRLWRKSVPVPTDITQKVTKVAANESATNHSAEDDELLKNVKETDV